MTTYILTTPKIIHWEPPTQDISNNPRVFYDLSPIFKIYENPSQKAENIKVVYEVEIRWTLRFYENEKSVGGCVIEQLIPILYNPCEDPHERIINIISLSYLCSSYEFDLRKKNTSLSMATYPEVNGNMSRPLIDQILDRLRSEK